MAGFSLRGATALLVFLSAVKLTRVSGYVWPNHTMDELDHLLVDTSGFNDGNFSHAIEPCEHYVNGNQSLGRQTSAQWLRVAFHEFATANVAEGTGGFDASISFETLREENHGTAFNDSFSYFAPFVNAHRCVADILALAVVTSVESCSSPPLRIPLRAGRVDATGGGAFGVPEPETSLEDTLNQFAQAGFNQADTIALTACGHTMGHTHHQGFPEVVPESAVTPDNLGGGISFDATTGVFDVDVVSEYLAWEGQKGGPLVTTENVTVRSDLRLYMSDGNATMKQLATSAEVFGNTCIDLFTRMINTVPKAVTLTEVISPLAVKPVNVSLDLTQEGELVLSGFVRLLSPDFDESIRVTINWAARNGMSSPEYTVPAAFSPEQVGGGPFGRTYYHAFEASIDPAAGISTFIVSVDGIEGRVFDNEEQGFGVQDEVFWLPGRSSINVENGKTRIVAAVVGSLFPSNVKAIINVPTTQFETYTPRIAQSTLELSPTGEHLGGYAIFSGETKLDFSTTVNAAQASLSIVAFISSSQGDVRVIKDDFRRLLDG